MYVEYNADEGGPIGSRKREKIEEQREILFDVHFENVSVTNVVRLNSLDSLRDVLHVDDLSKGLDSFFGSEFEHLVSLLLRSNMINRERSSRR